MTAISMCSQWRRRRPHLPCECCAGRNTVDVDTSVRTSRRTDAYTWLRRDTRGRHGGIRQERCVVKMGRFRRSVAGAAQMEQVVDPHLHHLSIAVALGESVAGKEWRPSWN